MKKLLFALLFTAGAVSAFAQQIRVKKGVVLVDGRPYARLEHDNDLYYLNSLQNQRLFAVKRLALNDPAAASAANPTGQAEYLQFVFTGAGLIAETPYDPSFTELTPAVAIAHKVYQARLIQAGALDPRAVADFVAVNGDPYSVRRRALDQPSVLLLPGR